MRDQETVSVRAQIALREMILDGRLRPGHRLREVALSEHLAISRTPLREALARLEHEGLLERIGTGGYTVKVFTVDDAADAIELRGVLEGTALRRAAERGIGRDQLAVAERLLGEIDRLVAVEDPAHIDLDAYADANMRFHDLVRDLAGSRLVAEEIARVGRLPFASPSAFLRAGPGDDLLALRNTLRGAHRQHRAMIEAVTRREGSRAEALAREHCRFARVNLEGAVAQGNDMRESLPGLGMVLA